MKNKNELINWLIASYARVFPAVTVEQLKNIEKLFRKKEYDDLYRLANMVDRFGWEAIFEVFDFDVEVGNDKSRI